MLTTIYNSSTYREWLAHIGRDLSSECFLFLPLGWKESFLANELCASQYYEPCLNQCRRNLSLKMSVSKLVGIETRDKYERTDSVQRCINACDFVSRRVLSPPPKHGPIFLIIKVLATCHRGGSNVKRSRKMVETYI
ncbi:hypothetical protein J3458_022445 [Metarhizium acridum]|uniref:uncharacterized protein n=1 Tax=Metarhizium acridum TaxID=92637 RepID=UPI001C6ABD3F|nr:hypothetical protein J3458_022445 [Metarhizium acridum]